MSRVELKGLICPATEEFVFDTTPLFNLDSPIHVDKFDVEFGDASGKLVNDSGSRKFIVTNADINRGAIVTFTLSGSRKNGHGPITTTVSILPRPAQVLTMTAINNGLPTLVDLSSAFDAVTMFEGEQVIEGSGKFYFENGNLFVLPEDGYTSSVGVDTSLAMPLAGYRGDDLIVTTIQVIVRAA